MIIPEEFEKTFIKKRNTKIFLRKEMRNLACPGIPNLYKFIKTFLKGRTNQKWDDIYSKFCTLVPKEYKGRILRYVLWEDDSGKIKNYRGIFYKNMPIYKRDEYYVDKNGILKKEMWRKGKKKEKTYKKIQKKEKPLPWDFKYDYTFEFTMYGEKFVENYYTCSVWINEHQTFFTIKQFIDWAEKNQKTYIITIYQRNGFLKKVKQVYKKNRI